MAGPRHSLPPTSLRTEGDGSGNPRLRSVGLGDLPGAFQRAQPPSSPSRAPASFPGRKDPAPGRPGCRARPAGARAPGPTGLTEARGSPAPAKLVRPSPRPGPERTTGVDFVSFFKPQRGPRASDPDSPPWGPLLLGSPRCVLAQAGAGARAVSFLPRGFSLSPSRFPPFLAFFLFRFLFLPLL